MTLAVMQPYLFPYIGYYQLVKAVDIFIFFDDVNFINRGWINRNQILQKKNASLFTLPLKKASQNRMINEIEIADFNNWRKDFLKSIEYNYKKAPFFSSIYNWLNEFLFSKEYRLISKLAADSVQSIAMLLEIPTKFKCSSDLDYKKEDNDNGQDKIIRICEILGANRYINPKNGVGLYDDKKFSDKNIELKFINMEEIVYPQFDPGSFVPCLSAIDVLMFNSPAQTRQLLDKYTLN